jgi:replicative DNA helicase
MNDNLTEDFLLELFKISLNNRNIFEVVNQYLKFHYIPDERLKKIWKEIQLQFKLNNKLPSIGVLILQFRKDHEVQEVLAEIKTLKDVDEQAVIGNFEEYIKQSMFVELYESTGEMYNQGDKHKAYNAFAKGAEELGNFSIKKKYYTKVFGNFTSRVVDRAMEDHNGRVKIPTGIPAWDKATNGGHETGEYVLMLGDSGVGKSMALSSIGITAARLGYKVGHIQVEGTKKQCEDRYDAAWTGSLYYDVKNSSMEDSKLKKCREVVSKIGKGEIYIEAFESFNSKTLIDVRNIIIEMKKLYGDIKVVLLDYLELIEPGDGIVYGPNNERHRQQKISRGLKQMAMEQNVILYTVTQATSLPTEYTDDPNFVLTRYNLSEDKGKIRPADGFITINRTRTEAKEGVCRLFFDKFREHVSGQTVTIYQNLSRCRFYDHVKTLKYVEEMDEELEEAMVMEDEE